MEDYRLEQSGQEVQDILNGAAMQVDLTAENERAELAEQTLQGKIDDEETRAKAAEKQNADDIDALEEKVPSGASSSNKLATEEYVDNSVSTKQDTLTFDNEPTDGSNNPVKSGGVYSADKALSDAIEAILLLIPSAATSLNKLADKAFVNSSIATASATFRGTYNLVTDLSLTVSATHAQIATALAGAVSDEDNNDYAFVQIPTSDATPTQIAKTERYKFNGTAWEYEYDLNNSGYTAAQWAAINSGITAALVTKLSDLPMNADLTTALGTLTSSITAINQKIPAAADQNNKLVDTAALESYIVQVLGVLTASFNITSSDGHVTVQISQVDGKITSVAVTGIDIASAASLSLIAGRVTTAEGNISTNADDIANLQAAYAALTQSDIVVVSGALPSSGQQQNIIYRQPDQDHTPPQFYSDYMWNGTAWVLMATYNNAIDPRPKKASQNLVTSGGVFDNMGALDVSELNATENPHTLATYADLSAALAAIPSDYQKGGMSIKFVQTSDNKYARYDYLLEDATTDSKFTNVANWENKNDRINELSDEVYGTNLYLDVNNSSFPSSGITSQNMMLSFIKDFKMLIEREEGYEYGIMKVNNGLPSGVSYAYFIGLYKWAEGSMPTGGDFIASYQKSSNPANGKIYLVESGQTFAEVVVDWSALTEQFGDESLYSGVGRGVKYNQQYIFDNSAPNGILLDIKSLQEEASKIPNLEERIEDVEKQVRPEQIVYKNDSQDITNCSKGYNAKGHAVFCANAKDSLFDTIDIPFSSSSGIINATLLIGQTNSTDESGVRDALSQQNLLVEKTIQLGSDIKYKRIDLGESIKITKDNAVVAVTYSSNMPAVYHASHDGMSVISFFYSNGNWYYYSDDYNESYGAYPRFIRSAGEVIHQLDNLEEEVDALEEEILENIGIYLPDTLYAVVGDTLQLFHRAIIKVPNPSVYDVQIVCSKGKDYPRYFEYAPTVSDVGQTTLTIYVKNSNRKVLAQKSCTLMTVNVVSSPSSAKKILCFGDSLTVAGTWCAEAYRRLTGSGGTPEGKNLSNIAFCGSMMKNGAGYFGEGGWEWASYTTPGWPAYRFQVTGVSSLSVGATYSNNGLSVTIQEINVTGGIGNILCSYTGSGTPQESGILTKINGDGDSTITYTAYSADSQNPLWDYQNNKMTFIPYANRYCNGQIDVVYVLLGWNQITPAQTDFTSLISQVKTFADTLHSEFPSAKLKIVGLQINSLTGGMAANYGASGGYSDEWGIAIAAWNLNKAYIDFANSVDYSGFVEYVDIASQFDTEYNMPYTNKDVNTRNSDKKELVGTNGVHPSASGYYQIADSIYRNAIKELCQ